MPIRLGLIFIKTGFCPYISSLFVCKDRRDYYALSPKKYQSFDEIEYGNYNPLSDYSGVNTFFRGGNCGACGIEDDGH